MILDGLFDCRVEGVPFSELPDFSSCVQSIRVIYDVVVPTGTVGYAPGFTGSMNVVAHNVANKEGFMLISRILSVPHPRLEWTDTVHELVCL